MAGPTEHDVTLVLRTTGPQPLEVAGAWMRIEVVDGGMTGRGPRVALYPTLAEAMDHDAEPHLILDRSAPEVLTEAFTTPDDVEVRVYVQAVLPAVPTNGGDDTIDDVPDDRIHRGVAPDGWR